MVGLPEKSSRLGEVATDVMCSSTALRCTASAWGFRALLPVSEFWVICAGWPFVPGSGNGFGYIQQTDDDLSYDLQDPEDG